MSADAETAPEAERRAVAALERIFGASMAWVGLFFVIFGERATRLLPAWPAGLPGRPWWAHGVGLAILVLGVLVATRRRPRAGAVGLAILVLLAVFTHHLPRAIPSGVAGNAWLGVLKFAAMAGAALFVAHGFAVRTPRRSFDRVVAGGAAAAPWLMGAFMAFSGYIHLQHTVAVTRLLPPWMPWPMFWVRFTGGALIAGGVGLVIRPLARPAAFLTGLMILGFFALVHVPRTIAAPLGSDGWMELGESMAYAAFALLMAVRLRARSAAVSPSGLGVVLALLLFGPSTLPAQSSTAGQRAAVDTAGRDGRRDFDFELGTWRTQLRVLVSPLAAPPEWAEYTGTSVVSRVWGGDANLVELDAAGPRGRIVALSLRLYDPATRQWSLNFANARRGVLTTPAVGAFADGRGEFHSHELVDGRIRWVRFEILSITGDSIEFVQSVSSDGGRTWVPSWIAIDTRVRE